MRSISTTNAYFQLSNKFLSGHFTPHPSIKRERLGAIIVYHLKTPHGIASRSFQPGD